VVQVRVAAAKKQSKLKRKLVATLKSNLPKDKVATLVSTPKKILVAAEKASTIRVNASRQYSVLFYRLFPN